MEFSDLSSARRHPLVREADLPRASRFRSVSPPLRGGGMIGHANRPSNYSINNSGPSATILYADLTALAPSPTSRTDRPLQRARSPHRGMKKPRVTGLLDQGIRLIEPWVTGRWARKAPRPGTWRAARPGPAGASSSRKTPTPRPAHTPVSPHRPARIARSPARPRSEGRPA
jgi:hypothetical protein